MFKSNYGANGKTINIYCSNNRKQKKNSLEEKVEERIIYENEEIIKIKMQVANIRIAYHDGDEILLLGKSTEKDKILLGKGDNIIFIETIYNSAIGIDNYDNDLDIYIPNTFKGKLQCDIKVGAVSISNIEVDKVDISGGECNVVVRNILFNQMNVVTGVGETDIYLSDISNDIYLESGVGDVKLDFKNIGGNLIFKGGVGTALIKIPIESPIDFKIFQGMGEVKNYTKTSAEKLYRFEVNVGVGKVIIKNN